MKPIAPFHFTPEQLADMRSSLKEYLAEELEISVGDLQADLLLQFLHEAVVKHYYNLGVTDTIKRVKENAEDLVLLIKD